MTIGGFSTLRTLFPYTKKYKKQLILGPFFKFVEAIFELLLPIGMAMLIDNGIRVGDFDYVKTIALIMILMSILGLIAVLLCQYYSSIASQGFGTNLRQALLTKINSLSHHELDKFGTATLITRMTSDTNQLQLALAMLIRLVMRAPFLSIGSLIMAFYISPKIALIFVGTLLVFCIILWGISKKTVPLYRKLQGTVDKLNQVIAENLSGVRVIRAFAQQDYSKKKMADTNDDLARAYQRVANISAILNPVTILVMNGAIILILMIGGNSINTGSLTQGELLALINYLTQMLLALIVISNLVVIFSKSFASAGRVSEVLNSQSSITELAKPVTTLNSTSPSDLAFENVSFNYQADSGLALDNINFNLLKETTLGVVGTTGSGKSSLIQLAPRFYDPTQGQITLFGTPLKTLALATVRESFAIVPQQSMLFTGTIRDNLKWGKKDATDEDCWIALTTAQSADFVRALPKQLDTFIQEGGKNFSGGQRQRLTIARAIISQPTILILDDSLSALYFQTDANLRQSLSTDLASTTTIIISQRISSIKSADQILVLDNGRQVGLGTHNDLLDTCPEYQQLCDSQQVTKEATYE